MPQKLRFVHVSDIHFSNRAAQFGFDPDRELRSRLVTDVKIMRDRLGKANAILVSGDVAYSGKADEFEDAAVWLDELCDAGGCPPRMVLMCPGNHDVDQSIIRENPLIQDGHDAIRGGTTPYDREKALESRLTQTAARALFYQPMGAYNLFAARYESSFFADANSFVWEKPFDLNDGSILRIRGLNSALLSGLSDRPNGLYLGPRAYTLHREEGVEYLTMSHHPPSWLLDGKEAESALNNDAKIQLFGHEHDQRVYPGRDWVKIFAGAVNPHRGERNWEPGYNVIELFVDETSGRHLHIDVHVRAWNPKTMEFYTVLDRGEAQVHHNVVHLAPLSQPRRQVEEVRGAAEVSAEDVKDAPMAGQPDFRSVVYDFFRLSLSKKNEIVGHLRLAEESDTTLPDVERFKLQLVRARERRQLNELEKMIRDMEGGR